MFQIGQDFEEYISPGNG
uniref:Uncharacterized protein n=1 Tax=Anguilla anguilla TaxID=7936 RepID=A0A0E9RI29_ANGAN